MIFLKGLLLPVFILASFGSFNQLSADKVNESPYHVIYNHLYYLQEESYDPEKAARSFNIKDLKEAKKNAIRLKQILDGNGAFIFVEELPKDPRYVDSVSGLSLYKLYDLLPDIYLEFKEGKWFYSAHTVKSIPRLFNETYPFGQNIEVYFSAPVWKGKFLGIKYWQWFCLLILLIAFYIAFLLIGGIFSIISSILSKSARLRKFLLGNKNIKSLRRILALWVATVMIKMLLPSIQLPPVTSSVLTKGLDVLSIFFIIILIHKLMASLFDYFSKIAEQTENTMDDQLLPVIKKIVNVLIWIVGVIFVLSHLNINVTAILAGLSIGGLALALAAQDTVKNFFGSVMIFLDRPFQIGDWIHFDDIDGIVEEVGIRSTRIRTFSNSLVYVPNAHLADATIDNLGLRKFRRYKTEIGVTYDTPPKTIDLFVEGIKQIIENHPTTRKDYFEVSLNSFGSSSLNILVYTFFAAEDWSTELKGRHEVIYAIIKLANDIGVRFAFPTQTIHIEDFPEKNSLTPISDNASVIQSKKEKSITEILSYFKQNIKQGKVIDNKPLGGE